MSGPYLAAAELLCDLTEGSGFASMRASAESRHGLLRSEGIVDVQNIFAVAGATSHFRDTITVNALVAPGTVGTLDIRMPFSGQLLANLSGTSNGVHLVEGSARFDLQMRAQMLNSGGLFEEWRFAQRLAAEGVDGDEAGVLVLPITFVFGEPIQLAAWLSAGASAVNCGSDCRVTASSRYGTTAWMEGIREVRLLDETPVADFQITSDSGTDYTKDQLDIVLDPLFDRYAIVTHPGQGADGADVSMASESPNTTGSDVRRQPSNEYFRIADQFTLDNDALVNRILTYAFETNSAFPTWSGFSMNLWDGRPGDPGSQILATSTTAPLEFIGAYRIVNGAQHLGNTQRPIHALNWRFDSVALKAGTYWVDWQVQGGASGWANPAMEPNPDQPDNPTTLPGSARHLTVEGWTDLGQATGGHATPLRVLGQVTSSDIVFRDSFMADSQQ